MKFSGNSIYAVGALSLFLLAGVVVATPPSVAHAAVNDACEVGVAGNRSCGGSLVCISTNGAPGRCQPNPDVCSPRCTGNATCVAGICVGDSSPTTERRTPAEIFGGRTSSANSGGGLVNPLNASSIPELLAIVLSAVVELGSIAIILALVWVGFKFVVAQGSQDKIKEARQALMWTVIGGLLLLGAAAISMVVQSTVEAL